MSKIENIVGRTEKTTILKAILKSSKPEFLAVYVKRKL